MNARSTVSRLILFILVLLFCGALAGADDLTSYWQYQDPGVRLRLLTASRTKQPAARTLLGAALIRTREDATAEAVNAWRAYYLAAPTSWAASAYWPDFVQVARDTGRWSALEDAAHAILAAKGAPLELRTSARLVLADALDRAGKPADADRGRAALGYVRKWRVIGPFENVSQSGFDKAFPPETEIAFNKSYPGADNLSLQWHDLLVVSRAGECLVGVALGDRAESAYYAVTAVNAAKAQPVWLHFNPTGASKIFVNGRQVFTDELMREADLLDADPFRVRIELQAGWNTILVKLASSDYYEMNYNSVAFGLRLTTLQGGDLPALPIDPAQARTQTRMVPDGATATAECVTVARLRALEQTPEVAGTLGFQLSWSGDNEAAVTVLRPAVQQAPKSGWLHWALSQALSNDECYDEAKTERELARKHNPHIVEAEIGYFDEQSDELDPADYLKLLKQSAQSHPASASLQGKLVYAYLRAELVPDAMKAAERAYQLAGGTDNAIALIENYDNHDRAAEANKLLQRALLADPCSSNLLERSAYKLSANGKSAEAIARYQQLLQLYRPLPYYRQSIADLYLGKKNYAQAEQALNYLRRQCPQDAEVCTKLADVMLAQQRKPEAIALYKLAITLDPTDVSLRSKVKVIAGEKPVIELAPITRPEPILIRAAAMKKPGKASACILLKEAWGVVYPDYATEMHEHIIMKVFDKAGVEQYESFSIGDPTSTSSDTIESARLIKADGTIEDLTDEAEGCDVTFPSLAPGDVIDVTCRIEDYPRGALNQYFWADRQFTDGEVPIELSRYLLITPPDMNFTVRTHGDIPEPAVTEAQGWRIRDWRKENIPAGVSELGGPGARDVECWLDISTIPSWREITRWYRDLAGPRCVPDAAIRAKATELTKDAGSEEAKIRALVDYVAREIRYQSMPFRMSAYIPTKGKKVMRDRYGDCKDKAALLAALLATIDIKADLALVNPRSDGLTPVLPSPRFTHVINRIHTANGPVWVDATAEHQQYGMLPTEDQGIWALIIDADTSELAQTPVASTTELNSDFQYDVNLDAAYRLQGALAFQAKGELGGMLRYAITQVPESGREMMLRMVGGKLLPALTYDTGSLENLEDREQPMVVNLKFHADNYGAVAGNFVVVRMPWMFGVSDFESMFSGDERKQDLEIGSGSGREHFAVRLQLPTGYTPQELPPVNERTTPWGNYRVSYHMDGTTLIAEADRTLSVLRIPAKDFPGFRDFIRAFQQEEKRQIVLVKQ